MAFLEELKITGSLGNLSFYHMRGVDRIVVRQKGGAPRDYVKNSPTFALPRLYMSEFGGCSKMGKEVRFMMHPVRNLADYNFSGFINKALKIVQKQDGAGALGRRSIELSRHTGLLAGFQLNKNTTFDSVIRAPLSCILRRDTLSARVAIPALLRDINFHPNNRHARFRIEVSLGIVPDFTFDAAEGVYKPRDWYTGMFAPQSISTPWYPALKGSPATSLEIKLTDQVPADERYSLMLTVGVRYGSPMEDDLVTEVKRAGVGKVIAVAGQPDVADAPVAEEVTKGEPLQPRVAVPDGVGACVYGWQSQSPVSSARAVAVVPASAEIKSSSGETEELVVTEGQMAAPEVGKPAPGLKTHASLSLQKHDDPGGNGNDQEERPDIDEAEE